MCKIIIIDRINKIKYQFWQRYSYNTNIEVGPTCTSMPTLAGAYLHAHSLIKARILSICFQNFTIWHLCTSRTHLNVAIISLFLANIWYLIKLIHSIIIILRVFMFYKQRVLANFWGRKDSATCASRKRSGACYCAEHMKWAMNSLFMPTALSFRPQKSAKTRYI